MNEGVTYDRSERQHRIVLVLDPDEAENIAHALGLHDAGAEQLIAWADEARALNSEPTP